MFDSLLIANRGEIACRIIRTARKLGLRTIAVYSDADRQARHVALADEAWHIGPAPAAQSYLQADKLLDVARRAGAGAIHPGYGFLAENADFAAACGAAGLTFIGPTVEAIRAMGSKSAAKTIMQQAGVPLVPGYHGDDQDLQTLRAAAGEIGFPLLVKASAGGGGKGMRVVRDPAELDAAIEGARREAAASFGDDKLLLERYLEQPRHVEIQVFADSHGRVLHLFERDCSVQRRHQKVLEEAPAPGMTAELRRAMGAAAVTAAEAIGYVGAGTVEFLLDTDGSFYFMEMNTRLQVEHPVTELITGQDLVDWQLRVAAGEPLPCRQEELNIHGHAIEARIYAEDPARDFLPSIGCLHHLQFPSEDGHLRIDTGVRQGDEVSIHYDPMIAKLIVWDRDRPAALRRLRRALEQVEVAGVKTNVGFLSAVAGQDDFAAGTFDTGFIEQHRDELIPETAPASDLVLVLASLYLLLSREAEAQRAAVDSHDPWSPWHLTDGWRLNDDNHHRFCFTDGETDVEAKVHYRSGGCLVELSSGTIEASGSLAEDGSLQASIAGRKLQARVVRRGAELDVLVAGHAHRLLLHDPYAEAFDQEDAGGSVTAPMPGKIIAVMVDQGARVKRGTPLVILEAMKMEHTITAPADGVIAELNYQAGALVDEGAPLLVFDADEGT
ncbi:acetyl/propionyl/methylcrotonyl-CoA carboxylase subunit alpha [Geothermobacter hydrogeniphilus]|uniref:3-methylcrotonyl-CoA carboxylase n=1 Tax=Geothermobacter hydrogeniphilus TaxID=1969733 RepID=A0A1X0XT75_9BACT|nr:acetyl/propionyl/methylcrotonyl-CoA carboxylase subunit alpha [Geothermobacter hydrogeniphilus]ORJ56069.1 3-methylcrotonyl-CoA carboxylase [Geothermobacter hydrogeniphilus]